MVSDGVGLKRRLVVLVLLWWDSKVVTGGEGLCFGF